MSVAWVGAGIAAVGTYSASQSAGKAEDRQIAGEAYNQEDVERMRLAEQNTYDEWQSTYGPIESNLSEYFNSLSPESYAVRGLESQQQAFETSMTRINESLAQRGITNTAIGASIESQALLGNAEEKARIRAEAPAAAARDKLGFLQLGLGKSQGRDYGMNAVPGVEDTAVADTAFDAIGTTQHSGGGNGPTDRPGGGGVNPSLATAAPVYDVTTGELTPGYSYDSDVQTIAPVRDVVTGANQAGGRQDSTGGYSGGEGSGAGGYAGGGGRATIDRDGHKGRDRGGNSNRDRSRGNSGRSNY